MSKPPPDRTIGNVGAFTTLLAPLPCALGASAGEAKISLRINPDRFSHGFGLKTLIETTPALRFARQQCPDFLRKRFVGREQDAAMTHER